jgi:hypothetical protein
MSGIHLSEVVIAFMLPYCWKFARYSGLGKAGKTSGQDVIKRRLEELSVTRLDLPIPQFSTYAKSSHPVPFNFTPSLLFSSVASKCIPMTKESANNLPFSI